MSKPVRRFHWTTSEIEVMLQCLHNVNAGRMVMISSSHEIKTLFQRVADDMKVLGYSRSVSQLRSKFMKERSDFYESFEQYGGLPPRESWGPRFHMMEKLWEQAGCPDSVKPAVSGKLRLHRADKPSIPDTVVSTSVAEDELCAVSSGIPTTVGEVTDISEPSLKVLVNEVRMLSVDMARVMRSSEFMRQGLQRITEDWDNWKLTYSLKKQQEESSESKGEEEGTECDTEEKEQDVPGEGVMCSHEGGLDKNDVVGLVEVLPKDLSAHNE